MNKKLMIVMLVVGASALYVRFQVVGMESDDRIYQAEERRRAAGDEREQSRMVPRGSEGFVNPKRGGNREDQLAALLHNMDRLPLEMQAEVLSLASFPLHVKDLLYEKLSIPTKLHVLQCDSLIRSVAFSSDGTKLATGCDNGMVHIWNVINGQRDYLLQCDSGVFSLVFSRDSTKLAIGIKNGTINIWNAESGKINRTLSQNGTVFTMIFSSDGRKLSASSVHEIAVIWDIEREQRDRDLLPNSGSLLGGKFSPDGMKLARISLHSPEVYIWDVLNGRLERTLTLDRMRTSLVTFSPDNKKLATVDRDKVSMWDVASGQKVVTLRTEAHIYSVTFSPDGTKLATGFSDEVAIWDVMSGLKLNVLPHDGEIFSVKFSFNGTKLVTGSRNGTAIIWDVDCLNFVDQLIRRLKTNYAWFELMRIFERHLIAGESRVMLNTEQMKIFETLPQEVQNALAPLWSVGDSDINKMD